MTSPRGGLAGLVFILGAYTRGGATRPQANTLQRVTGGLVIDAGQSAADPVEASACEVVAALARGDFAGVTTRFDDAMRDALPEDRLEAFYRGIEGAVGWFVAMHCGCRDGVLVRA